MEQNILEKDSDHEHCLQQAVWRNGGSNPAEKVVRTENGVKFDKAVELSTVQTKWWN